MIQVEYTDYTFDQYKTLKEAEKGILQQFSDSNGDSLPLDIKEFPDMECDDQDKINLVVGAVEEPIAYYSCKWLVELKKVDE